MHFQERTIKYKTTRVTLKEENRQYFEDHFFKDIYFYLQHIHIRHSSFRCLFNAQINPQRSHIHVKIHAKEALISEN